MSKVNKIHNGDFNIKYPLMSSNIFNWEYVKVLLDILVISKSDKYVEIMLKTIEPAIPVESNTYDLFISDIV